MEIREFGGQKVAIKIEEQDLEELQSLLNIDKIDGIAFADNWGNALPLCSKLKNLKALVIIDSQLCDMSTLSDFRSVTYLSLSGSSKATYDLSDFKNLKFLQLNHKGRVILPQETVYLKQLILWAYKSPTHDMNSFHDWVNLEDLQLIRPTIHSLRGIDKLKKLKKLTIYGASKLTELDGLQSSTVQHLVMETCQKIQDYAVIEETPIKALHMDKTSNIPSLDWVTSSNLETFSFWTTKVEDCDLTPLKKIPNVAFQDKRGYNMKSSEFTY